MVPANRVRLATCLRVIDHSLPCAVGSALDAVWALQSEARRFGELCRVVQGISEKMVIQHLKEMEADGIVTRFQGGPARRRVRVDVIRRVAFCRAGVAVRMGHAAIEDHVVTQRGEKHFTPPSRPSAANRSVSKARFRSVLIICLPPY